MKECKKVIINRGNMQLLHIGLHRGPDHSLGCEKAIQFALDKA
jgi:hypothetical protein